MSTETIAASPVTALSYPCTCRPGCGQTMATPAGEAHGWALACYKRWQRAGKPAGGPPPPLPVGRQPRSPARSPGSERGMTSTYVTREEGNRLMAELARLRGEGLTIAQAAAVLGISASAAGHYANRQLEAEREAALSSAIEWPEPSPPIPGAADWRDKVACRSHEGLFFAPEGRGAEDQAQREIREAKAKSLCAACPVRPECLDEAFGANLKHGVRGGMDEAERARARARWLRQKRGAAA